MPPRQQDRTRTAGAAPRRRRNGGDGQQADWALANPLALQTLIAAVTAQGGAVRFGYSRDGGAYSLGILGDGDPYTEWIRPHEDVNAVLAEITRSWTGELPADDAPSA